MTRCLPRVVVAAVCLAISACAKKEKLGPNTIVVHPAPGTLEMCILANGEDDAVAFQLAREWFQVAEKDSRLWLDLRRRAERGEPPPAPMAPAGTTFQAAGSPCAYRWSPISRRQLKSLGLHPKPTSADDFGVERYIAIAKAREAKVPYVEDSYYVDAKSNHMYWSRVRRGPDNESVELDYFLLVRVEPDGDRIRAEEITIRWDPDRPMDDSARLLCELDDEGREKLARLTVRNGPGQSTGVPLLRELAILIRGEILITPVIREPMTKGEFILTGHFTRDEVDELIKALAGN